MYACASGHEEIVKDLLKSGARVEDNNENGHTPLMEAASAGHVPVAKVSFSYTALFTCRHPRLLRIGFICTKYLVICLAHLVICIKLKNITIYVFSPQQVSDVS